MSTLPTFTIVDADIRPIGGIPGGEDDSNTSMGDLPPASAKPVELQSNRWVFRDRVPAVFLDSEGQVINLSDVITPSTSADGKTLTLTSRAGTDYYYTNVHVRFFFTRSDTGEEASHDPLIPVIGEPR